MAELEKEPIKKSGERLSLPDKVEIKLKKIGGIVERTKEIVAQDPSLKELIERVEPLY